MFYHIRFNEGDIAIYLRHSNLFILLRYFLKLNNKCNLHTHLSKNIVLYYSIYQIFFQFSLYNEMSH